MTPQELREWWSEYSAARVTNLPVSNLWRDEQRFEDSRDVEERKQLFCAMRVQ